MINIGTNTLLHRYVSVQSGDYGIAAQFVVNNTNSKFDVQCSGKGKISFAFGLESGSIYASGNSKVYFDAIASNTSSDVVAFSVGPTGFDIYINDKPILVSQPKPTGHFEKVYLIGSSDVFTGTCNVQVFGNAPNLVLSNVFQEFVFPRQCVINTGVSVKNLSNVDARILAATVFGIESGSIIQSLMPVLVRGGEEGFVPVSGQYLISGIQQPILVSYVNDYGNGFINSTIVPTEFSGAGIRVTQNAIGNSFLHTGIGSVFVENTGTVSSFITPSILSTGLFVGYSGFETRTVRKIIAGSGTSYSTATGIFQTGKFISLQTSYPFFFSDRLISSKNDFYLVQNNLTPVPTYSISGSGANDANSTSLNPNHAGRALGFFAAKALGHQFVAPYDFVATYLTLPLRGNGDHFYYESGSQEFWRRVVNFNPEELLRVYVLQGTGIETSGALASGFEICSGKIQNFGFWSHPNQAANVALPSTMASGYKPMKFDLSNPVIFQSGQIYTILLSGAGDFMNQEVSGQRYVTWQALYHTEPVYPGNGFAVGPWSSGHGTGFCISNTLDISYFRGMGYQSYQPNFGSWSPIGDDNFSNNISMTGFLGGGVVTLQRFRAPETFLPSSVSLNFNSDDTDTLHNSELWTFQGFDCVLNAMICASDPSDDGFPDFTNIVCSGNRSHSDFYQHSVRGINNRNVSWVQERMFNFGQTNYITGDKNYWLVLSGTNYPPVKSLSHQPDNIPVVRFSHNFSEPFQNLNPEYHTNVFSGKKMLYVVTGNVFYSGDPSQASGNLFSSRRLSIDNWIQHRIFGDGTQNSGVRKQLYEWPTTMCFEFGIHAEEFAIWDTNSVSGTMNEFLSGNGFSYNKYATSRLFNITNPLPILLNAGKQIVLDVEYNGLQGYLDYGLLRIPEFNYTGFISGFTTV